MMANLIVRRANKLLHSKFNIISKRSLFSGGNLSSPAFLKEQWAEACQSCENLRKEIAESDFNESLITKLDTISNKICIVADACNFISSYHVCKNVAKEAGDVYIEALSYVESLNTDTPLYLKIKELMDVSSDSLDNDSRHAATMFLDEFEKSGTHFDSEKREIFSETSNRIFQAGSSFIEAAYQPTEISPQRCPTPLLNLMKGNSVSISEANLSSRYDDVREASWKLYHRFDKTKEVRLCELLNQRHRLASLSGFENYCDRELKGSLAKSPMVVQNFLNEINFQLRDTVNKEMEAFKSSKRTRESVGIWDISYYSVENRYKFLQSYPVLQSKLNLKTVLEAMNRLSQDMFYAELVSVPINSDEVWHDDVLKFTVHSQYGKTLGIIYCDFFERQGKDASICLHTIQCGTFTQIPIVALVCNFKKGDYIQISDVNLLFHEFGHALHAVLGRTRYQHVSGTRCPTDFAEIPSILLDSIVNQTSVMDTLFNPASEQGTVGLPNISVSDCYNATETQVQLYYAMLDQLLHSSDTRDTREVAMKAQQKYLSQFSIPTSTAWHQRFTHLYFYGGKYYSYLWAQAIVNMIIEEHNLKEAIHYVPEIKALFEQGGSKDCSYQIESLLGEPLSLDKMVASLVKPLASFNKLAGIG